jgi:hypothetical protein
VLNFGRSVYIGKMECEALSSMNIGLSANAWLSKWGTTRGASTLSRYIWPVRLPSRTYKSTVHPNNVLGVLCEAWRGVLQNFTINAVDILVIDFYTLHIRTIGLRWLIFRPIKSHTYSIGIMSGDIASHGIVWTASCCKKILYNSASCAKHDEACYRTSQ